MRVGMRASVGAIVFVGLTACSHGPPPTVAPVASTPPTDAIPLRNEIRSVATDLTLSNSAYASREARRIEGELAAAAEAVMRLQAARPSGCGAVAVQMLLEVTRRVRAQPEYAVDVIFAARSARQFAEGCQRPETAAAYADVEASTALFLGRTRALSKLRAKEALTATVGQPSAQRMHPIVLLAVGFALLELERNEEALDVFKAASVDLQRRQAWAPLADALQGQALASFKTHKRVEPAFAILREALAVSEQHQLFEHTADVLVSRAEMRMRNREYSLAVEDLSKASGIRTKLQGPLSPGALSVVQLWGVAEGERHNYNLALRLGAQAHEGFVNLMGPWHPSSLTTLSNIAAMKTRLGMLDAALADHLDLLELRRLVLGPRDRAVAYSLTETGSIRFRKGDFRGALGDFERAAQISSAALPVGHPDAFRTHDWKAATLSRLGRHEEAIEASVLAVRYARAAGQIGARNLVGVLRGRAAVLRAAGRTADADATEAEAKALGAQVLPPPMGTIDVQKVQGILATLRQPFRECYERAMRERGEVEGTMRLKMRVKLDGHVSDVTTTEANIADGNVTLCVMGHLRGVQFPRPVGGVVDVVLPLTFLMRDKASK